MRILYGVVGEGMGHATRSRVIIAELVKTHEVQLVVSGRACQFLREAFPTLKVHEIAGMTFAYKDNAVKRGRTALDFLRKLPQFGANFDTFSWLQENFRPELVISDFETFSFLFAKMHDLPILSIDNQQIINRTDLQVKIPDKLKNSFRATKAFVKAKLPRCDHYLVTTFFFPPLRKKRTSLYPPILRDAILDAKPETGEHVLVYQTSDSFRALIPTLQKLPQQFVVYGLKRDEDLGNVRLKPFSESGFVEDLRTARAVIAGGGFSLMGEAVFLGKPYYAVPIERQFEQTLNALYVEQLGYGEYRTDITEKSLRAFLSQTKTYAKNLRAHKQNRNVQIFTALHAIIERIGKEGRLA
jgi:uncharacterized protein (TIGR00661 family)